MKLEQFKSKLFQHPKRLFVIDGIGAILSAFLLGIVLVRFENIFGIPANTLYILAAIPLFFSLYDLYSYRQTSHKWIKLLKGIATMNFLYCLLSIGFAFFHYQTISIWGWSYIVIEILIVLILARVELKIAKQLSKSQLNNS